MGEPADNSERLIAVVRSARMLRFLWISLLAVGLLWAEAAFFFFVQSVTPTNAVLYKGMPIKGAAIGALVGGGMAAAVYIVRRLCERALVLRGGRLGLRGEKWMLQSVAANKVREIIVRPHGSLLYCGMDRGIGVVLEDAAVKNLLAFEDRLNPYINYKLRGYHWLIPAVFDEPLEHVALEVAASLEAATGHAPRIRVVDKKHESFLERPSDGTSLPSVAISVARPVGGAAAVARAGVACIDCGYDLRLLSLSANCPECGTPVARSLHGDLLHNSDPKWFSSTRRATALLGSSGLLFLIATWTCGNMLLSGVYRRSAGKIDTLIFGVTLLFALVIFCVAAWKLTRREPSRSGLSKNPFSRRAARSLLLAGLFPFIAAATGLLPLTPSFMLLLWLLLLSAFFVIWYSREVWRRAVSAGWRTFTTIVALGYVIPLLFSLIFLGPVILGRISPKLAFNVIPPPPASATASQPMPEELAAFIRVSRVLLVMIPAAFALVFISLWITLRRIQPAVPVVARAVEGMTGA